MLPAQTAVLGVASSTHDHMDTEEMKKRARDVSADDDNRTNNRSQHSSPRCSRR